MRHLLRALGLPGLLLLHVEAARAAEPAPCSPGEPCETLATAVPPSAPAHRAEVAILGHVGIATPVGGVGVSLDVMPVPMLGIEAGVGSNFEGAEAEAGARLRLPLFAGGYVTLGSGLSVAHYTGHSSNGLGTRDIFSGGGDETTSVAVWKHALFWNNELGVEGGSGHFLARFYLGYATLLNRSAYTCTAGYFPCDPQASNGLAYSGIAFGYVF
jgi:hypothetical protein